jgi:long-chain acyl-CoA synthetase
VLMPHHPPEKADSAGTIVFGTELRIVDEYFEDAAPGETGRICYRSAGSARSFLNEPEQSAHSFREGWFFPGDLGRVDADGFVYITGREKDMIIRGGANVYPSEIENVLLGHAGVAEAAVVGTPSNDYGEEIVAYVVLAYEVSTRELVELCRSALAPYKVPREIRVLAEMPKTAFGKIDKLALKRGVAEPAPAE